MGQCYAFTFLKNGLQNLTFISPTLAEQFPAFKPWGHRDDQFTWKPVFRGLTGEMRCAC